MTPERLQAVQAVALVTGGMLGALARAAGSQTQATWSRRTAWDVVLGGVFGLLTPLVPTVLPFVDFGKVPPGFLGALSLGALAFVLALAGNSVTTMVGWRVGFIKAGEGGNGAPPS